MSDKIKVFQVNFDRETKKIIEKTNVTERMKNQYFGTKELEYELQFKKDALNGLHGNVYYEIEGINYDDLNISQELKKFAPSQLSDTDIKTNIIPEIDDNVEVETSKPRRNRR